MVPEPADQAAAPEAPSQAEIEWGSRLATVMMALGRQSAAVASQLSRFGIDKTSMILLGALTTIGPARSTALAEAVHSDPSTISRQVAALVKAGLIERRADPGDGRASLLAVTAAGRELLDNGHRQRSRALARMLAHWPARDREQLVELLERFAHDHERFIPTFVEECAARARSGGEN